MAPMALLDSEVKTCSKACLKNYEDIKSSYDKLRIELSKSDFDLYSYKKGLESVEERLVFYKKNERMLCDQIAVLKSDASFNESDINSLKKQVERLKKEKEDKQFKIDNFENASKSLDQLIANQISDKNKMGLGYNAVPPPLTGLFAPPIIDLSHTGIEKFKEPEFEGYGVKVDKCVSETSPVVVEKKTVVPTIPKVDVVRPKQQEKPVRKTIRNFVPKAVLMKTGMRPFNAAKPKAAYNAVKRNRYNAVKALACWVWMPKNRMVDHVSKNISASVTLKRLDYIDAQGRFKWMHRLKGGKSATNKKKNPEKSAVKEKEESREECSKSRKT
ncbi:hypothetical protein Tco_1366743 [Tanacetum coccineum]